MQPLRKYRVSNRPKIDAAESRGFPPFLVLHAGPVGRLLLAAVLATLWLPMTASAGDHQVNSTGKSTDNEGLSTSSSQTQTGKPESASRWTVSAEAIGLTRIGGADRTLVERVPGAVPFLLTATTPGVEAFNGDDFPQVFSAGPEITLIYHDESGYGAELSYFNIFERSVTKTIGPDTPADWLVMRAPGVFWQTQDFPYQAMAWESGWSLYNAEANGRLDLSRRVTILAGFRWLQMNDELQGTLPPPDVVAPTWKSTSPGANIFQIPAGGTPAGKYPPFWNTSARNDFYGFQIGVDGIIMEYGRFSLDGTIKTGIYDNNAGQTTGVSLQKVVYPSEATTDRAAFVGEAGLQLKYRVLKDLSIKAGYEALWLDGVALAPGQIKETSIAPSNVRALGVECGSDVLFHGAKVGLEYSF